jgi:hypothetical protein
MAPASCSGACQRRSTAAHRCSSRCWAPTGTPSELSTDGCHGQMSRAGSAGLTGSGFLRTLSVRGHDFTRPGPRARGHMADRQDHKAGNRRDIRRSGYALINQDRRSVKPSAQPTQVRTLHLPLPAKRPLACDDRGLRAVCSLCRLVASCAVAGCRVAVITDI